MARFPLKEAEIVHHSFNESSLPPLGTHVHSRAACRTAFRL